MFGITRVNNDRIGIIGWNQKPSLKHHALLYLPTRSAKTRVQKFPFHVFLEHMRASAISPERSFNSESPLKEKCMKWKNK